MTIKVTYAYACDGCGKSLAPETEILRARLPRGTARADDVLDHFFSGDSKSVIACDWTCLRAAIDECERA